MYKRKSLSVLTAVIVAFTALVAPLFAITLSHAVFAEENQEAVKPYNLILDENDEHKVTGIELTDENATGFALEIPEAITEIGDEAFARAPIGSVVIPKTVLTIGMNAFQGCNGLTSVEFEERTDALTVKVYAFANCSALSVLKLPAKTTVNQYAFSGCSSLNWAYVGKDCRFSNTAVDDTAVFFPADSAITIIFPSQSEYNAMLLWSDKTFETKHGSAATYIVNVNCFVGASTEPVVYERLHGRSFNYVPDVNRVWNTDTAYETLPVQSSAYSSTMWYTEKTFENAVDYDGVNTLLETKDKIELYCRETIEVPAFPAEPVSWVYDKKVSYDIKDVSSVLKALGCKQEFTQEQLKAIDFTVSFADEKGNPADVPDAICANGVYSVKFSLKPEYGSWAQEVTSSITINVNTNGFTIAMIVLLVVGVLAAVVTVSTAVIRKKVQARNKKKQLSQREVLEKFKAAGGETTLE